MSVENGEPFVEVKVDKTAVVSGTPTTMVVTTVITSRGFNVKDSNNLRRVERAIEKTY